MPLYSTSNYNSVTTSHPPPPPFIRHPPPEPPLPPARLPREPTPQAIFSWARAQIATSRPWKELLDLSSFSTPCSYTDAMSRVLVNLRYFRKNYALVMLFVIIVYSFIRHPSSMITFLAIFVAWLLLWFFPVVIFGRTIDDWFVMIFLILITVVALVFTDVGLNVLVAFIIGAVIVGFHAAFKRY